MKYLVGMVMSNVSGWLCLLRKARFECKIFFVYRSIGLTVKGMNEFSEMALWRRNLPNPEPKNNAPDTRLTFDGKNLYKNGRVLWWSLTFMAD